MIQPTYRFILVRLKYLLKNHKEKQLTNSIRSIAGCFPSNISLYTLALSHASIAEESSTGVKNSYERLEYLGDAILGAVVAEYLFKKFPFKNEGFLTEIRARIVNRESLNNVGRKIGLDKLILVAGKTSNVSHKSICGDALEALIGAIYLDKGFNVARSFVLKRILTTHFDIEHVVQDNKNFKSILIEWAQRENKKIVFSIIKESGSNNMKEFTAEIKINNEAISTGKGLSKKKAEQSAAEKACEHLKIK